MRDPKEKDWAIIELQGDLKSKTETEFDAKFIGDLHYVKHGDTPVLIIGHHLLYGKEMKLEKPFALLEKSDTKSEYSVIGVITKKLMFRVRPKPIVPKV
ncbi:chromosome transmission fidelity protein 8 homolog isoform X2 [Aethina tumida]|uniref:chromosome transmission fidelity protein 8 homolog isoform X2 n=1 Tax=Aethina tumida TaxID=116153 RepID=UPI0021480141|nr:chromosome transmission fidelity protein 8 homolog isoform X2 [Aethina tumida]